MQLAPEYNVVIQGLHPCMRLPLKKAEAIWKAHGRPEGVTITCGLNGIHSASSWHYCGCAVDLRTNYFNATERQTVYNELKKALPGYDVVWHTSHIHVEPGDDLARKWGVLL